MSKKILKKLSHKEIQKHLNKLKPKITFLNNELRFDFLDYDEVKALIRQKLDETSTFKNSECEIYDDCDQLYTEINGIGLFDMTYKAYLKINMIEYFADIHVQYVIYKHKIIDRKLLDFTIIPNDD